MKTTRYLLTIKAEERPGLLHLVTGVLNRKLIPIVSLSAAPTDIHDVVLITMEVQASEKALQPLLYKLKNIVEVFAVDAIPYDDALSLRAAYFKMAKSFLESPKLSVLQKYGAVIVQAYPDAILIAKYGSDLAIRALYNDLDGPHLLGFSQTGLITETKLIAHEDIERIIKLAA